MLGVILLAGCSNSTNTDIVKNFSNNIKKSKSYKLIGKMELLNDEETFNYNVDVSYTSDVTTTLGYIYK